MILDLRDSLGATVVVVTHELASIFTIGNNSVFLDAETRTITASGDPKELLAHPPNPTVHRFLTRGKGNKYEHKVSPTLIGAFVVGALALLIVAVIAFGSGQLFRKTQEFILYFDGSVNGLRIGAPVKVKGVEIGSVKDIKLETELGSQIHKIPVIIEIDLKKVIRRGVAPEKAMDPNTIREFVKQGLHGQLQTESLVTRSALRGTRLVSRNPAHASSSRRATIFNTRRSQLSPPSWNRPRRPLSGSSRRLDDIDLKRLIDSLTKTSDGVGQLVSVNSPTLKSILQSVDQAMPQLRGAISRLSEVGSYSKHQRHKRVSGPPPDLDRCAERY